MTKRPLRKMTKDFIYQFVRKHTLATTGSISIEDRPESALVGIAVTPDLEIIFDTVSSSRKYTNILHNPHVALVIGREDETTLQYEGIASEVTGHDSEKYRETYFKAFPDGRQRATTWPGSSILRSARPGFGTAILMNRR